MMSQMRAPAVHANPAPNAPPHPGAGGGEIGLVAIDLDGTLLRSDKRVSRRAIAAIGEATGRGVHVVLASARPPRSVRDIYQQLGLSTLQINYNGALIVDWFRARYVQHLALCNHVARRIADRAREMDPRVCVSVEVLDRWLTDRHDPALATETARACGPDFVGPLDQCLKTPITKLMLLAPPPRMTPIREMVRREFAGEVAVFISDDHLTQVCHRGVEKSAAVAWVANHYGIDAARVMAIGDAPNDAAMLRWAGLGVAVANAWEPTRAAADATVPSNDDDGVACAIERYVLS